MKLRIHLGNSMQLAGASLTCYGIDCVAGLAICLIVAGVLLAVLANFEYDATVVAVPLPRFDRRPKGLRPASPLKRWVSRGVGALKRWRVRRAVARS